MEAILVECVEKSLGLMMYRNAIFMCQRLCAQFPSEINSQLLATCFLQSNQAYSAYHILKGTQMAQSRYLFALSCFHMDLLSEAEAALCPRNDPASEVPNGAAGHYLLGLVYRHCLKSAYWFCCGYMELLLFWIYDNDILFPKLDLFWLTAYTGYTDRLKSAIHHFNQALSLDPLLWVAYEELCILG
ncbi:ubiquitin-protein ligase [Lithospermum erythrorhizon]|uniref:Ubiquitin-protein ligase n=1 Tax=Lithospermum erythrorhizon TaxID=34254 RepID=A0AAV3RRS8_LITER